jgi:hypothetical protein
MQQFFQFIILTFVYSATCFGHFPAHHQELNDCSGSLWFYLPIVVIVVLCRGWAGYYNQFIILTFICSSTCFGRFPAHHQELNYCSCSLWFYLHIVVIVVLSSWSGRPPRPQTQHDYHHDTKVKPEAATEVIKLLIMGGKTPKTCWAVNKHQDNKLENCCIWLVIYLNCTMMHELTNLKCISYCNKDI